MDHHQAPPPSDPSATIAAKIDVWQEAGQSMARECDGPDYSKRCYACGAPATRLVAPGWGGVWACATC